MPSYFNRCRLDERGRIRHPSVTCDGCQAPLFGVRYKCAECFNTDFCEDCEARNVHGDEHVLLKIKKPIRVDIYSSFRSGRGGRRGHHGFGGPGGFGGFGGHRRFQGCGFNHPHWQQQQQPQQPQQPQFNAAEAARVAAEYVNSFSSVAADFAATLANQGSSLILKSQFSSIIFFSFSLATAAAASAASAANGTSSAPSTPGASSSQQPQQPQQEQYANELRVLHEMGFLDDALNVELLRARKGAVSAVIDQLVALTL